MPAVSTEKSRVVIQCTVCGTQFRVEPRFLNREAKCTRCGSRFLAKEVDSKAPAAGVPPVAAPVASPVAAVAGAVRPPVQTAPAQGAPAQPPAPQVVAGEPVSQGAPVPEGQSRVDARLGARLGPFKVTGVLGQGGMGVVYEAEDTVLERKVAIKVLPPSLVSAGADALERFLREARSACKLEHANVVAIYQVGFEGGVYFIAMQLVRGGSAADFIRQHGPMTPQDATRVVLEAAKGIAAAHNRNVIHRDIKPANIMLGESWAVKVTDFGLAKIEGSELTAAGGVMGTPSYMSPEACRGEPTDARSDLYCLGATYYCLLAGHPPFRGEGSHAIMYKHIYEPLPDPRNEKPNIPAGCVHVLARAMEKDPARRYQTAEQMIADLQTIDFSRTVIEPNSMHTENWAALVAATQGELSGAEVVQAIGKDFPGFAAGGSSAALSGAPKYSSGKFSLAPSSTRVPATRRAGGQLQPWHLWVALAMGVLVGVILLIVFSGKNEPEKDKKPSVKKPDETAKLPDKKLPDPEPEPTPDPAPAVDPVAREFELLSGSAWEASARNDRPSMQYAIERLRAFHAKHGSSPTARNREFAVQAKSILDQLTRETAVGTGPVTPVVPDPTPQPNLPEPPPRTSTPTTLYSGEVIYSPDGLRLLVQETGSARLISLRGGPPLKLELPQSTWSLFRFSGDSQYVAAVVTTGAFGAERGSELIVWRTRDGARTSQRSKLHKNGVWGLQFSSDGRRIVTWGTETTGRMSMKLWDAESDDEGKVLLEATANASYARFSPDGRYIALVETEPGGFIAGKLGIWNSADGTRLASPPTPAASYTAFEFDLRGRLVMVDRTAKMIRWDPAAGKALSEKTLESGGGTGCVVSPEARVVLTIRAQPGQPTEYRVFDAETAAALGQWTAGNGWAGQNVFSPDSRMVAITSWDRTAGSTTRLYNARNGAAGAVVSQGRDLFGVAFAPDGNRVVVWSRFRSPAATIWDVATGKPVARLKPPTGMVANVAFSPEGRTVTVGSGGAGGGSISTWDTADLARP